MSLQAKTERAILTALARWAEAAPRTAAECPMSLTLELQCPLCEGSTFCPSGCPMAVCEIATRKWSPIRDYEHRMVAGEMRMFLASGRECEACNVYGICLSCEEGRERRRARKKGSAYLVDSVPLYSAPGSEELTDPIEVTAAQVRRELSVRRSPQLELQEAA